ncbi:uncharacterized protein LOC119944122 [Tachyglossus aculeatus]|uniref:uncharacterized protein LOC119944122 n=1 Tax=Tachyglossus aculeatus TaxID=9261 RepID=UPI0018F46837|nr:uncharacterized protein LOC119944122 [Tachyglossus aculeatus]
MKVAVTFVLLSLGLFCSVGDACPDFQKIINDYLESSTDVLLASIAPYEPSDNALEAVGALKQISDAFTGAERKSVGETLAEFQSHPNVDTPTSNLATSAMKLFVALVLFSLAASSYSAVSIPKSDSIEKARKCLELVGEVYLFFNGTPESLLAAMEKYQPDGYSKSALLKIKDTMDNFTDAQRQNFKALMVKVMENCQKDVETYN